VERYEVVHTSAERTFELRQRILRPHQAIEDMAWEGDEHPDTAHLCVFGADDRVVGTASVRREAPPWEPDVFPSWRLRGMATDPAWRNRGIGTVLLTTVIDHVAYYGGGLLWCNARLGAISLYRRGGLVIRGEPWNEPLIGPHVTMERTVDARTRIQA
jgi:GNAT superfamily N-acetyltransferase